MAVSASRSLRRGPIGVVVLCRKVPVDKLVEERVDESVTHGAVNDSRSRTGRRRDADLVLASTWGQ